MWFSRTFCTLFTLCCFSVSHLQIMRERVLCTEDQITHHSILHLDPEEDLIGISVEGLNLEDLEAQESAVKRVSQGQRPKGPKCRSWSFEGYGTAMEDKTSSSKCSVEAFLKTCVLIELSISIPFSYDVLRWKLSLVKSIRHKHFQKGYLNCSQNKKPLPVC